MSEQRIQTVKIVWKGDEAKSKAIEFTRSIKGTDEAVEQLNDVLGDNATVTAKTALSMKEARAQAQKNITAANRLVTQHNRITNQLKQQIKMSSMSAEEQEIYAAQMRLGANATEDQREEIARLVTQLQKQRVATGQTNTSMRNFRGVMQNAGWQLQDTIVQLQMGTSAMVVLSQQGSQFASAFGPGGAVVGALIAVAGAVGGLAIKMITGKKSTKELAAAQTLVNEAFQEGDVQATALTETYKKLFVRNKELAILTAQQAKFAAIDQRKAAKDRIKDLVRERFALSETIDESQASYNLSVQDIRRYNANVAKLTKERAAKLGITIEQFKAIGEQIKKGAFGKASEMLVDIASGSKTANRELTKLAFNFAEAADDATVAAKRIAELRAIVAGDVTPDEPKTKKKKKTKDDDFSVILKEIQKEIDLREKALSDIEKSQQKFFDKREDPRAVEERRYVETLKQLNAEKSKLWAQDEANKKRVNALIEAEDKRHKQAMKEATLAQVETNVLALSSAAAMMTSTVDLLSNGVNQIKAQTAEMTATQKAMFLVNQSIAASMALINGISLGMELAKNAAALDFTGLSSAAMVSFGTSLGAAQAGAIMGTTIAGAFDKGGNIPAGQSGIVSEYGDELVNGVMVKGPARVTSREDTAKMMGGANLNVNVVNNASGVKHEVQQIDENTVKIIASEYFNENIDRGVASVIDKKGSRADKSLRKSYSGTTRRY